MLFGTFVARWSLLSQCKLVCVCRVGGLSPITVALKKQHEHTGPSDTTYSAYLIDFWAGRCLGRLNGRRRQRLGKVSSCAATRLAKITINLGPVVVSHLGSATARLLAPESRLWSGWYMQSRFFIRRGQCSQPNLSRVEVVDGHLYKAHVVSSDGAVRFMTAEALTPLESGVQIN